MSSQSRTCVAVAVVAALGCDGPGHGELSRAATTTVEVAYVHRGPGPGAVLFTDASGNVVEERRHEPFGAEVERADYRARDFGPLGPSVDSDTGWSFHGARWYQPDSARWLSIDPPTRTPDAKKYVAEPWSLHPYDYVDQNPVLYWDPDGCDKAPVDDLVARLKAAIQKVKEEKRVADKVAGVLSKWIGGPPRVIDIDRLATKLLAFFTLLRQNKVATQGAGPAPPD